MLILITKLYLGAAMRLKHEVPEGNKPTWVILLPFLPSWEGRGQLRLRKTVSAKPGKPKEIHLSWNI